MPCLTLAALWFGWSAPDDYYQQGSTIRLLFIHVPAAITGMSIYACLAGSAFFGLGGSAIPFWPTPPPAPPRRSAPPSRSWAWSPARSGAGRCVEPWVGVGRAPDLVPGPVPVLFVGYMALQASIDDETKADRASGIWALVGALNLPIIYFSVQWWNSLHQGETIFAPDGSKLAPVYDAPLVPGCGAPSRSASASPCGWCASAARSGAAAPRSLAVQGVALMLMNNFELGKHAVYIVPAYAITFVVMGRHRHRRDPSCARAALWKREVERLEAPQGGQERRPDPCAASCPSSPWWCWWRWVCCSPATACTTTRRCSPTP